MELKRSKSVSCTRPLNLSLQLGPITVSRSLHAMIAKGMTTQVATPRWKGRLSVDKINDSSHSAHVYTSCAFWSDRILVFFALFRTPNYVSYVFSDKALCWDSQQGNAQILDSESGDDLLQQTKILFIPIPVHLKQEIHSRTDLESHGDSAGLRSC